METNEQLPVEGTVTSETTTTVADSTTPEATAEHAEGTHAHDHQHSATYAAHKAHSAVNHVRPHHSGLD